MICEKCARNTDDRQAVVTTLHIWMRLCPACREKWGARDEAGAIIAYKEKKTDGNQ